MKRCLFLVLLFSIAILTVSAGQDIAVSLKNCSSYSETGTVKTEGMTVQSSKQILGWEGDRCVYKEKINFSGVNTTVTCKFTQPQLTEITSVMNAYSLVQKYSNDKVDTSSLSGAQNNPIVKVWNKYLQDASVCKVEGIN